MLRPLNEVERQDFREWMGRSVRALVRDAARVDDPTELELLAARLVPSALLEHGRPGRSVSSWRWWRRRRAAARCCAR